MIYFDHNASSPMSPAAKQAWLEAVEQFPGNPSSQHRLGQRADRALENAQEELAAMLNCHPDEIVWTSGATESNNLVLHQFRESASSDRPVLCSPLEHPSIREPLKRWHGNRTIYWPLDETGILDYEWFSRNLLKHNPSLVATMAANNETGAISDWEFIADTCAGLGIPYLCDATQFLGRIDAAGLGKCNFITGSAHKFGGPRGAGFLKISTKDSFKPMFFGGAQQNARRAGTENVPGILGMVAALTEASGIISEPVFMAERTAWKQNFERAIQGRFPGASVIAQKSPRLWNTSAMIMPEIDCRNRWVVRLDRKGIAASTGSACASGNEAPSETLLALGYTPEQAGRALRFSSGIATTEQDWHRLAETLESIYHEFKQQQHQTA